MKFSKIVISATTLAMTVVVQACATTDENKFIKGEINACILEGAAEWRATFDAPTTVEQEILDIERRACHLLAAREIDYLMDELIAEDGIILLEKAGLANGRESQRQLFKSYIDAGYDLAWDPVDATVSASQDLAYAIGVVRVSLPDGSVEHAKYTSIWKKIDGRWQNVLEMRNDNGDLGTDFFK